MNITLDELLHPITREEFFASYFNKQSLLVKGDERKFDGLFSWNEINRIAKEHRLQPPEIRLSHEGKTTDDLQFLKTRITPRGQTIYSIDIPVLYRLLREGASLVVDAVDEMSPTVSDFCESLGREFHCQFSTNAYSVWGNNPGFGTHWDDHDLFVVQISGRKHWKLFGATRKFPMDKDFVKNPKPNEEDVIWEDVVEPGDAIYIPRGHWHCATGMNEPTLHLTIGMNNPTSIELLTWLIDDLRNEEIVRRDVPRFDNEENKQKYVLELTDVIRKKIETDILNDYVSFWKANNQARTRLSLPYGGNDIAVPQGTDFFIQFSGISHSAIKETANGLIKFETIGKEIELALQTKPFFELLLTGRPVHFEDILNRKFEGLSEQMIRKVIDVLVKQGILQVYK